MTCRDTEIKNFKALQVIKQYYTEDEFNRLYEIFLTYRDKGGILKFCEFVQIPIKHNPGNIEDEFGIWTKWIRKYIADNFILAIEDIQNLQPGAT